MRGFVASNPWTLWTSLIVSFALVLVLSCSEQARCGEGTAHAAGPLHFDGGLTPSGRPAHASRRACCLCRRQHPLNMVMLLAFTLCEAVLLGAASATYDTRVVVLALGITAGVVCALSLFALQTK